MAEASLVAFGIALGVAIAFATVCLAIRGKGHHDEAPVTIRE